MEAAEDDVSSCVIVYDSKMRMLPWLCKKEIAWHRHECITILPLCTNEQDTERLASSGYTSHSWDLARSKKRLQKRLPVVRVEPLKRQSLFEGSPTNLSQKHSVTLVGQVHMRISHYGCFCTQ